MWTPFCMKMEHDEKKLDNRNNDLLLFFFFVCVAIKSCIKFYKKYVL